MIGRLEEGLYILTNNSAIDGPNMYSNSLAAKLSDSALSTGLMKK